MILTHLLAFHAHILIHAHLFAAHAVSAVSEVAKTGCGITDPGGCVNDVTGAVSGAACSVPGVSTVCGAVSDVTKLPGIMLGFANELAKLFTDFPHFLQDMAHYFIFQWVFPSSYQTFLFGTLGVPGFHQTRDYSSVYQGLYVSMSGIGLAIAAAAAGARVLRTLVDMRSTSMQIVVDVLVRFAAVAILVAPTPGAGVPLGYNIIAFGLNSMATLTSAVGAALAGSTLHLGIHPGQPPVEALIAKFTNGWKDLAAVTIGSPLIIIFALYALVMLIIRGLLIGFCIATAPLCIATAAFDTRNKFFAWWLDLFVGAMLTGLVLSVAFFVSLAIASNLLAIGPMAPVSFLMCIIVWCGSIWMAGKMVHQLTWKHFSHGGALGAFGAMTGAIAIGAKVGYAGQMMTPEGGKAHSAFGTLAKWGQTLGMGFPLGGGGHGGMFGGGGGGGGGGGITPASMAANAGGNRINGMANSLPNGGAGLSATQIQGMESFGAGLLADPSNGLQVGSLLGQMDPAQVAGMSESQKLNSAFQLMQPGDQQQAASMALAGYLRQTSGGAGGGGGRGPTTNLSGTPVGGGPLGSGGGAGFSSGGGGGGGGGGRGGYGYIDNPPGGDAGSPVGGSSASTRGNVGGGGPSTDPSHRINPPNAPFSNK